MLVAAIHPSPSWVEARFSNGYYPGWQQFWASITRPLPFALGDAVVLAGAAILLCALFFLRPWYRAMLSAAAAAAFYAIWFYCGWGFGYDRAPLQTRVAYDASRVNDGTIERLRARAIANMNRLAPIAHAEDAANGDDRVLLAALRAAWLPVVDRSGDRWRPSVFGAKPSLAGWFMDKSGTSGFTNPFTLETQLAPDLLPFERPFSQAHEWSHVAGFNREDEANYIAILTCTRSDDALAQYSGWLELFLYLPPKARYARKVFVPQVWADFQAIRRRNAQFVNLDLSRFSWRVYNSYLKSNRIASGVRNYGEVTKLLAGVPLDDRGLPLPRKPATISQRD